MHATRAAVEEGIVPGGGVAYLRCLKSLDKLKVNTSDNQIGINIVKRAIEEPNRQIVINAGKEGAVIVEKVKSKEGAYGYNAATEKYEDLMAAGIIDPTKVTRTAIENASSVAALLLMTEGLVADKPEKEPPAPPMPPGGGMGGMY